MATDDEIYNSIPVIGELIIPSTPAPLARLGRLDGAILAWLKSKSERTGSARTRRAYSDGITSFRAALASVGLDLDGDPAPVALVAQEWAARGAPAATTYNQRLAILASFYAYAIRFDVLAYNPIDRVDRRPASAYESPSFLPAEEVRRKMKAIDRSTMAGLRDVALLSIGFHTGRRLSELAGLTWGDVLIAGDSYSLSFRRTKGGKATRDQLSKPIAGALLAWLHAFYGAALGDLAPDSPLWVSLSSNGTRGRQLDRQSIADICMRRLGISKVHSLRHTFARTMEDAGAKVSEIQAKLQHASAHTTTIYLRQLRSAENPYAAQLDALLGLD